MALNINSIKNLDDEAHLSTQETAELLDKHPASIRRYIEKGTLIAVQVGGVKYISAKSIKAMLVE